MVETATLEQLPGDHALVDQIDPEIARPENLLADLKLTRVYDGDTITMCFEVLARNLELRPGTDFGPVNDGYLRPIKATVERRSFFMKLKS